MPWPRRDRKGMRRHRGALSHNGSISYGGQGLRRIDKLDLLPSPGLEAPARFGREKLDQGSEEKMEGFFTWEGPSTDYMSISYWKLL